MRYSQNYFIFSLMSIPPIVFILNLPDEFSYLIIGLWFVISCIMVFTSKKSCRSRDAKFIFLSIFIPVTWISSSLIGVINGADGTNAIRNFFGLNLFMILFLLYYFRPSQKDFEKPILFTNFLVAIGLLLNLRDFSLQSYLVSISLQEFRLFYTANAIISVPAFVICFNKLIKLRELNNREVRFYFIHLLISLFSAFVTFSKGIILAIFIMLIIYFILFFREIWSFKISTLKLMFIITIVFMVTAIVLSPFFEMLVFLYSNKEGSNAVRSEQFSYLVDELHFWGAGLGTELKSGYKRDDLGYGFELTLVNLVQKMGIFSSVYLLLIVLAFVRAFSWVVKGILNNSALVALACLIGSLLPGSFNPLLFAPFSVIIQMVGVYLAFNSGIWRPRRNELKS